jgi:hypothetical protein
MGVGWGAAMFVNTSDFLRQSSARSEGPSGAIPWDAWVPSHTRIFPMDGTCTYSGSCANRSVCFDRTVDPPPLLRLLDFNPFSLSPATPPSPNTSIHLVEEKSVVERGPVFQSDVFTSLPYREISVEFDGFFNETFTVLHISTEMIIEVSKLNLTLSILWSDHSLF